MLNKPNTELIYGIHPIIELLKAKRRKLLIIYTTKPLPKGWKQIAPLLPKGIQIQYVARPILNKMSGTTDHQGVMGYAAPFVYISNVCDSKKYPILLMLDSIQDPRNLGAIIRSAYCTNIDGLIITQKGSAPINATTLKASAGLAEHLPIMRVPTAKAAIELLKKAGYHVYLAVLGKGEAAHTIHYQTPLCIVIGSEEMGISSEIRSQGTAITLPQKKQDISYNASVAAGILLFLMATQQKKI